MDKFLGIHYTLSDYILELSMSVGKLCNYIISFVHVSLLTVLCHNPEI